MMFYKIFFSLLWIYTHLSCSETLDNVNFDADDFIKKYVNEVQKTLKLDSDEHKMVKRNTKEVIRNLSQLFGLDLLVGFQEVSSVPAQFPNDLILLSQCNVGLQEEQKLFAVALEGSPQEQQEFSSYIALFKYQNNTWKVTHRVPVVDGVRLAKEQFGDSVYVAVAEHHRNATTGTAVFRVNTNTNKLEFVHKLKTFHPSHIIMWEWENVGAFAAVAISENPSGSEKRYETLSPVYQWKGDSFDEIGCLLTFNPQALVQFSIHNSMFIAVANYQNDLGDTTVTSDIYRYSLEGKLILHQKLPTQAAIDVKYFCFVDRHVTESFLIFASAHPQDPEEHSEPSIIYKLSSENYFVPFQALREEGVTSWVPVKHTNQGEQDSFSLLAVGEDKVTSYHYDGWRFVPTGLLSGRDDSSFGPGPKILNVFYHDDLTLISIANKWSEGCETNVFSLVTERQVQVEEMQETMLGWQQQVMAQLTIMESKVDKMIKTAEAAPRVSDEVINLGPHTVFHSADIDSAQTFQTQGGDSYEDRQVVEQLNNQLRLVERQLQQLTTTIDSISYSTNTIYEEVSELSANFHCKNACEVDFLDVIQMNNENFTAFIENVVNINEPLIFEDEIAFEDLALVESFKTKRINNHPVETLIDWTKEIKLDHGLEVQGDVILETDFSVCGLLDRVAVNFGGDSFDESDASVAVSTKREIDTLNASQLFLFDGLLSQVNFKQFNMSTLKTYGDQIITEFMDVGAVEVDEVDAREGLLVSKPLPYPFVSKSAPCEGELCQEDESSVSSRDSSSGQQAGQASGQQAGQASDFEPVFLPSDPEIVLSDLRVLGSVTIQNGSLQVEDLIDEKHNISAKNILNYGVLLNASKIDQHFIFNAAFKAPNVVVDRLNGVDLEDLIEADCSKHVVVKGKKKFLGDLVVDGPVIVGTVNGESVTERSNPDDTSRTLKLSNLTVNKVHSVIVDMGGQDWQRLVVRRDDGGVYVKNLRVEEHAEFTSVMVRGRINSYYIEELLDDTVFKDGKSYLIFGKKSFAKSLKISNLTLDKLNNVSLSSFKPKDFDWKKHLSQATDIRVDHIFFTGFLDGIDARDFGEWLLTEGDQTVEWPQFINSFQTKHLQLGRFNTVDIKKLASEGIFLNDNITLNSVVFEKPVHSHSVNVRGKVSGLLVPEDLVLFDSASDKVFSGHKHLLGSLTVLGRLQLDSNLGTINLTQYCQVFSVNNSDLIIQGNSSFLKEPFIHSSINNNKWTDLMHNVWFKEDNVNISRIMIHSTQFNNLFVDTTNDVNTEEFLLNLVSLSQDQEVSGTFYFSNVTISEDVEVNNIFVGGKVQGLSLESFVNNVLLDGVDQKISEIMDFTTLVVDGVLYNEGLVNGLNLSTDVMRTDVASNTVTSQMTVTGTLTTRELTLPPGTRVAGVDLDQWKRTAASLTKHNVINGSLVFKGELDTTGIIVKGLINGLPFDEKNILLVKGSQQVTGLKTFSPSSLVQFTNLSVQHFFNNVNLNEFFQQQITKEGNLTMSGANIFSAPLRVGRVILPEMYQGHNLTWLETLLSYDLPWAQYNTQQRLLDDNKRLVAVSLAGRPYYLKDINLVQNIEALFAFPLKRNERSAIAVVRDNSFNIMLSFLTWNDRHNSFMEKPGTIQYFLRFPPAEVQSVALPGGEIAAYVTSYQPYNTSKTVSYGELFRLQGNGISATKIPGGHPGSLLLSYQTSLGGSCFVLVTDTCRVFCGKRKKMSFPCHNIAEAAILTTAKAVYMLGLQTGVSPHLLVWQLSRRDVTLVHSTPLFNPVSITVSDSAPTGPHVAVATRHRLDTSVPESVDIYSFNEETSELVLEQMLPTIAPTKVMFATLPTREPTLYVISDNAGSPMEVFLYRGMLGYQRLKTDTTLPVPSYIHVFTDHHHNHFVISSSKHYSSVLKAHFT